jgi:2-polyprenyl-3-methyl-5-hydroxy-6-metoxy-1,4-benzoquinol methylase
MGKLHEKDFKVEEYDEFYSDHYFQPLEKPFDAHRFIPRVAWALDVAKEFKPKNVLDLGCLDGFASLTIAKHCPGVKFIKGVDLSKDGIEIATERAKELNVASDYEQGTIEDYLERTKTKFDLIMLFEVIEHVKSPRELLKLIDRECSKAIIKVVSSITTDKGDAYYQNIPLYRYVEQMRAELLREEQL